jgi:hypothetical protein
LYSTCRLTLIPDGWSANWKLSSLLGRGINVAAAKQFTARFPLLVIILLAALRFLRANLWRRRITNATGKPGNNQS